MVNVDDKLGLLTFKNDHNSHISIIDPKVCSDKCKDKPCTKICPAKVYEWVDSQNKIVVGFENCIECGAARMLCPYMNIKMDFPRGGFGVKYKYG